MLKSGDFMNLDGLSILEVIEIYSKIPEKLNRDIFVALNTYLHKRIQREILLTEEELQSMDRLVNEIERLFKSNLFEAQKKKLFEKSNVLVKKSIIPRQEKVEKPRSYYLVQEINSLLDVDAIEYEKLCDILVELEECINISSVAKGYSRSLDKLFIKLRSEETLEKIGMSYFDYYLDVVIRCENKKNLALYERSKARTSLNNKVSNKVNETERTAEIKEAIKSGKIVIKKEFPLSVLASIKFPNNHLDTVSGGIITIDDAISHDLDGAFSIMKDSGYYVFNVYVTDVASFLKDNRKVSSEAYKRGCSFYANECGNSESFQINMLPDILSCGHLSLLRNKPRDVLNFSYVFREDGTFYECNLSRKQIRVNYSLTPRLANGLLDNSLPDRLNVRSSLLLCKELMTKVVSNSNYRYLKSLRPENISDFVSFPSILTNYFVANTSQFVILRDRGRYTMTPGGELYSHTVTPLRRFVSDINLAFFLNQEGVVSFNEKDLNFVEKNIEEIIEHLNMQHELSKFVEKKSGFVKRYMKG